MSRYVVFDDWGRSIVYANDLDDVLDVLEEAMNDVSRLGVSEYTDAGMASVAAEDFLARHGVVAPASSQEDA